MKLPVQLKEFALNIMLMLFKMYKQKNNKDITG